MSDFRRTAVHLALAAMLLRALLPVGWMPNPAGLADGTPFVICTLHGPITAAPDKKAHPGQDDPRAHEVCPFAAAATLSPPVAFISLAAPQLSERITAWRPVQDQAVSPARYLNASPRAPPVLI